MVLIDANEVRFPPHTGLHVCPHREDVGKNSTLTTSDCDATDMVWFRNIRQMACYGCGSLWAGIEGEVMLAIYAKHFNLKEDDWSPNPAWQKGKP